MRCALLTFLLACACGAPAAPQAVPPPAPELATAAQPSTSAAAPAPTVAGTAPAPGPRADGKLNVVLITIDAFRADHAPWLGYGRDVAPNLTKLAARSTSYGHAYALSSYTAMSVGSLLAGRYAAELERSGYFFSAYPEEVTFFPELLQSAGVRTIAAHAHFYFDQKSGFRQGFDVYEMVPGISTDNKTDKNVTGDVHADLAIELLGRKENTAGPFFAWFHFMDPHDRYREHDGFPKFGAGGGKDRYDGEIYFTDHHVGRLLEFIAQSEWGARTAIIVSADHGEAFGEHKMTRHGFELWEPLIRVPLLVALPGATARSIDTPRSAIDLAPTILELLGTPAPASFQGKSLVPEVRGTETPELRDVVVDLPRTSDNWRRRALVHDHHKILAFDDDFRFELYDLAADPGEALDLRLRDKPTFEAMKKRYLERVKAIPEVCPKMRHKLKGKRPEREC
jgi:choline-sulfatase